MQYAGDRERPQERRSAGQAAGLCHAGAGLLGGEVSHCTAQGQVSAEERQRLPGMASGAWCCIMLCVAMVLH